VFSHICSNSTLRAFCTPSGVLSGGGGGGIILPLLVTRREGEAGVKGDDEEGEGWARAAEGWGRGR
jgi:hypothetical protein